MHDLFDEPPAHRIRSDAEALETARAVAAEFAREAIERDRDRRLPWKELAIWSASGLAGITVPREYGGAQVKWSTLAEVFRLLSVADPALGQIPQNHFGTLSAILRCGTPTQQEHWFGEALHGRRFGNAGPERTTRTTLEVSSRLEPVGDGHTVSGTKFYSTGALFAHWVPIKALDEQGRLIRAIVRRDSAGLTVLDDWSGFGQRTTASGTVQLDRVPVPRGSVLPLWALSAEPSIQGPVAQIMHAAIELGIAEAALEDTRRFVTTRARPWVDARVERAGDDPLLLREVGRLRADLLAGQAVLRRVGRHLDALEGLPVTAEQVAYASVLVAKAKAVSTEIALEASEKLIELCGAQSTLREHGLDRHWRNARTHTLHDPVRWKYHLIGNYHLNHILPNRHAWN